MAYLNDDVRNQVKPLLDDLPNPVELKVLTGGSLVLPGKDATGHQRETTLLLGELAELSVNLTVVTAALSDDPEAKAAGIERAPTILFRRAGDSRTNLRFAGLPSGYEFTTLLEAIRLVAATEVPDDKVGTLAEPVELRTFVTPTCPYCPQAVVTAFELALANHAVIAEGIEANEFPVLSQSYRISSVPDTVIGGPNGTRVLGAQPKRAFVEAVRSAAGTAGPAASAAN